MISKLDPGNGAHLARKWSCVWRPDIGSRLYARGSWQAAGGVGGLAWLQTGIAQTVAMYTYQSAQRFISESPWEKQLLLCEVARQADRLLGGQADSALYLDETAFAKKGKSSVGVARQYNGRLGKVDNAQVVVSAALGCADRVTLVDFLLYMPKDWIDDPDRCEKAGVPTEVVERGVRAKWQLGLDFVDRAIANSVRFHWVGADGGYGHCPEFLWGLVDRELEFMAEVHSNHHVYLVDPAAHPQAPAYEVKDVAAVITPETWTKVIIRPSTKGELQARLWRKRIWVREANPSEKNNTGAHRVQAWWLLVREDSDGKRSYALSNASASTSLLDLAKRQAGRFWIERAFEDAKSEVGMAQFQVRGWRALHHHLAMCLLALLFITKERVRAAPQAPLVSAHDVVELLDLHLQHPAATEAQFIEQIANRHRKRQRSIDSARRRNSPPQSPPPPDIHVTGNSTK
jgi:SRSO17 transposase